MFMVLAPWKRDYDHAKITMNKPNIKDVMLLFSLNLEGTGKSGNDYVLFFTRFEKN